MNNNWYNERLVQVRSQELEHEIAQQRLLREAGLAYEDRLAGIGRRLYGGMRAWAQGLKNRFTHDPASYKPAQKKII